MCHRPGSFAHDVVLVLVWAARFFLSGPVGHLTEHGAGMDDFCAFPVSALHYGVPVSAAARFHGHRQG